MNIDYIDINKKFWNENTPLHVKSPFYDNKSFIEGRSSLTEIDIECLSPLNGRSLLHLQCHFGQDTLSMARMGAHVTGVDFSDCAIKSARQLALQLGIDAHFIESDVLYLNQVLDKQFDIVYSSYGTIGWLPDINKWAEIVHRYLKPGGQFHFIEFHPFVWMYDHDFSTIRHPYFNVDIIQEEVKGSYAAPNAELKHNIATWNHTLSDVIQALIDAGLSLTSFKEYDYSPYDIFDDSIKVGNRYQIKGKEGLIPLVYALHFTKNKLV